MRRLAAVGAAFVVVCCGHDNPVAPTPSPEPPSAVLAVSVNAQPVVAGSSPGKHLARWNVVIRETAGVGGAVNFINATIRDADSGAAGDESLLILDGSLVATRAGTNRVPGAGSLTVPESHEFSLDSGGTKIVINVAVQFSDDNGHLITGTGQTASQ